jgi:peptidoglycan hydrolase-like protein with peptidoglycan-binding domain
LKPGESGADIEQLQIALRDLGHYGGGDKKGYFGAGTKAAVQKLYAKLGFEAADTGGPGGRADRQRLADSAKAVEAVQDAVSSMNRRIDAGETAKPGEKPLAEQLMGLKEDLDETREALADVVAHTGPMVPMSEVVFVPSFPARISGFSAKVGDPVKAPLLIISAGRLGVTVKLRPEQAALVRAGMKASLTSETLGHEAAATVASVGELKVDGETNSNVPATGNAPYHPLVIHPDEPLPGQWSGQEIRVTIVAARTAGPVLVVPLSAVSAGADGRTMVSVIDSSGATLSVEVRAGVSGNGFVEVTPLAGSLNEGDRVVVGTA